jgi:hypothetical protein
MFEAVKAKAAAAAPQTLAGKIDQLLVDADGLCYFCAGAADCSPAQALANVQDKLTAVEAVAGLRATLVATHEDSPKGGRYFMATVKPYQGQRYGGTKPKNWEFLRKRMMATGFGRKLIVEDYAEADDRCMSMAGPRTALHYQDKDFQMMPGWHITWKDYALVNVEPGTWELIAGTGPRYTGNKTFIGKVYGEKWFWLQMLMGDGADNIPGLEKYGNKDCGPATAEKILAGTTSRAEAAHLVAKAYLEHYGKEEFVERLLEQGRLLWMRKEPLDDDDLINRGPFQALNFDTFGADPQ